MASAISETIELPALQTVNRTVELNINDRLTVTVTANNNDSDAPLSARVLDPMLRPATTWTNYRNNSFTYIASELSGTYTIGIVYGNETIGSPSSGIEVTFSYEVEHLSITSPQPTLTEKENPQPWTLILIIVAVVALVLILVLVLVLKRKK